MANPVDKQAKDLDYLTPPAVLDAVRDFFGGPIPLDPATTEDNPTGARWFFTPAEDGLVHPWTTEGLQYARSHKGVLVKDICEDPDGVLAEEKEVGVYVNCPYGKQMRQWLAKIVQEARRGCQILALLPVSRTEQAYMQEMMAAADAVCWIRKRLRFLRPSTGLPAKGNPYASALWGFNTQHSDHGKFHLAFHCLGQLMYPKG